MKIMLTGSSGMIGSAVETVCAEKRLECIPLSHQDLDITDCEALKKEVKKLKPDVIFNAVGIVGVNPCEEDPQTAFNVNAIAVSNLAKICVEEDIILVQPGSHAIFDGEKTSPYTEADLHNVISIYSATKYLAECFALNLCPKHYVPRYSTLFGVRRNLAFGFTDKVLNWAKEGKILSIADDKLDSPTYSLDAAKISLELIQDQKPYGIYHIANTGMVSYYDFVVKFLSFVGLDAQVERAKDAEFNSLGHKPLRSALCSIKLDPLRSWEDALLEYVTNELN